MNHEGKRQGRRFPLNEEGNDYGEKQIIVWSCCERSNALKRESYEKTRRDARTFNTDQLGVRIPPVLPPTKITTMMTTTTEVIQIGL